MKKMKIPNTRLAKKIPTAPPIMALRLVSLDPTVGCCVAGSLRISEWKVRGTLLFLPAFLQTINGILYSQTWTCEATHVGGVVRETLKLQGMV